jgi:hypothetical protein
MRDFVMPYLQRRLRGRPTGDGYLPKRPELLPLESPFGAPAVSP